jgi:hypothetical protein
VKRPVIYLLVVALLSGALTGTVALALGEHRQAEDDRRWCVLLTDLDTAYKTPPGPSTDLSRAVAAEIHRLRVGFGCPPG